MPRMGFCSIISKPFFFGHFDESKMSCSDQHVSTEFVDSWELITTVFDGPKVLGLFRFTVNVDIQ